MLNMQTSPKLITRTSPSNYLFDYLPLDLNQARSEQELELKIEQPTDQGLGGNPDPNNKKQTPEQEQKFEQEEFKEDEDENEEENEDSSPEEDNFEPDLESENNDYSWSPPTLITKPKLYEIIDNTITRNFESWYDFVTCVSDPTLRGYKEIYSSHKISDERTKFTSTKDFPQAIHMALISGWPEGRKLLSESLALVAPKLEPYKSISYEVAGAYPLVPLFLTGEPGYMINFEHEITNTNPIIKIDYNFSTNVSITAQTIMLRGAAVLSLCNILENRGFSVELRLISNFQGRYENLTLRSNVIYKRAGENLDLDRDAFAIAHPSTLRRLTFALIEQHKELEQVFGKGYGTPMYEPNEISDDVIFIPPPETNNQSPSDHQELVNKCAEKYLTEANH